MLKVYVVGTGAMKNEVRSTALRKAATMLLGGAVLALAIVAVHTFHASPR